MWLNLTTQNKRLAKVKIQPIITVNKQKAKARRRQNVGKAKVWRRFPPHTPPNNLRLVLSGLQQRYNGSTKCQNHDTQMLSEIRKPKKKMRMKVGPHLRCGRMTATRWLRVPLMRWMKSRKKTSHGKSLDAAKRFTVAKSKIPHPWRDGGLTLSLRLSVSRMYCRLRVSASN